MIYSTNGVVTVPKRVNGVGIAPLKMKVLMLVLMLMLLLAWMLNSARHLQSLSRGAPWHTWPTALLYGAIHRRPL